MPLQSIPIEIMHRIIIVYKQRVARPRPELISGGQGWGDWKLSPNNAQLRPGIHPILRWVNATFPACPAANQQSIKMVDCLRLSISLQVSTGAAAFNRLSGPQNPPQRDCSAVRRIRGSAVRGADFRSSIMFWNPESKPDRLP